MNARILELIKNPEIIQSEDLNLLESEIKTKPYIQNIRALYLYGTHQFNPKNYQKELSKTAAYTTDKKILYQFINKKTIEKATEETETETVEVFENSSEIETNKISVVNKFETQTPIEIKEKQELKPVFINGERNRILFEGEEDFWDRPSEKIDIQKTLESGENITAKSDTKATEISDIKKEHDENESQELSSDLSFHRTEDFMPNVSLSKPKSNENYQPKPSINKYEEEMKRLIAKVEAKIKAKKEAQKIDDKKTVKEEIFNNEINFVEVQRFDFNKDEIKTISSNDEKTECSIVEKMETEMVSEQHRDWKPMSFESQTPDALINKTEAVKEEISDIKFSESEPKSEERPVFNVSFFSPDVSKIEKEETTDKIQENTNSKQSNIPQFINTWQNWLKIERVEPQPNIEEIKEKAIENFIEKEPKISKLKEETNFVVKEKDDDISHLMTETFAKLYVEQRLYTKAINAFEILKEKHPEKKDYFEEKIEKIKQIKLGNRF